MKFIPYPELDVKKTLINGCKFLSCFCLFVLCVQQAHAQSPVTIAASGGTWTVPAGVTSATFYIWGGGGGGGGGKTGDDWGNGGGGGGGACGYVTATGLTAGTVYTATTIGAGGANGAAGNNAGAAGGTTTFAGGGNTWTVAGGSGGAGSSGASTGTTAFAGGAGGATVTGTGIAAYAGGAGSAGNDISGVTGTGGGAGGSGAAGTTPASACGVTGTGGAGTYPGGNGGYNTNCSVGANLAGVAGSVPGGGGSGDNSWISNTKGGSGAAGEVIIVYHLIPTITSFTPTTVCIGSTVTITGTNLTGATAVSFNGVAATSFTVVNSTTITAIPATGATSGTIAVTTSGGTATSSSSITILSAPAAVTVAPATTTQCGGTVVLTASGGTGGTIYWQNTTSGGTSTATASSSQTVSASGTYYFNSYNGSCWGAQGSASVTINPIPAAPAVSPASATICSGQSTGLTGTSAGNTINWYNVATGGTPLTNVASGTAYTVSPTTTATYYAESKTSAGCVSATRTAVTVTVNLTPGAVTVSGGGTACGSTLLTATDGDGYTIYWENNTSGGTSTGTPSSSETVTASGTYYFNEYTGYCWGTQGSAAVTINPVPSAPTGATASPGTICAGQASQITATSTGNNINWWTAATGGTELTTVASGAGYTVTPASTTTYYAEAGTLGSTVIVTNPTSPWTVPAGVTSITVDVWGGGGAGGGSTKATTTSSSGGGGGGGAFATATFAVSAGQTYAISSTVTTGVGYLSSGGPAGAAGNNPGSAGGTITFSGSGGSCSAAGGSGGGGAGNNGSGTAGAAGTTGTGTIHAGGAGAAGSAANDYPGGGGGGGGSATAGTAAVQCTNGTGGTGTYPGGAGGDNTTGCGSDLDVAGTAGTAAGGGGSGAVTYSATTDNKSGGAGGAGQVIIIYSLPTGCVSTTRTPVAVTVNPTPGVVNVSGGGNYCGGSSTILTASDTDGYQIYWQNTTSGGTSTATPSASQTVSASGTYYFNEYTGYCWGTQDSAIVVVGAVPAAPAVSPASPAICTGQSVALTGTSAGNSINWYTAATGGTLLTTVASGIAYTVTPAGTTTYYAETQTPSTCLSATRTAVTVTVNPVPGPVAVSGGGAFCGNAVLTASGGAGGTIYWQNATSNGTSTATPSSSQTVTATGVYYFNAEEGSCWGTQGSATVTIGTVPAAPAVSPASAGVCSGTSINLTGTSTGNNINWWTAATGGTLDTTVASGDPYAVAPATATTYYAEAATPSTTSTVTIISSGSWTVPAGVVSATVYLWGGGGGGGGSSVATPTAWATGGGGGGAACSVNAIAISPGQVWTATIGAAGVGGTSSTINGTTGGTTTLVNGGTTLSAAGGSGGTSGTGTVNATHAGGAGGSTGTGTLYAGGGGSASNNGNYNSTTGVFSGGITGTGGGAGGTSGAGTTPASSCVGPAAGGPGTYPGGAGGYNTECGQEAGGAGVTGGTPGGGGSGGSDWTGTENGGPGAAGEIIIVYTIAPSCASATRTAVAVSILTTPAAVTVSGGGTLCGSSATLTAGGGAGGTIYWQGTTRGGTSTATASSTETVTSSGTYYFNSYNGTCWGAQDSAVVALIATPAAPTAVVATPPSVCVGSSTVITATSAGNDINWWTAATGGTLDTSVGSGDSYQIAPASTSTYYAEAATTGGALSCPSATRVPVTVTVVPVAGRVTVTGGGTVCGSATLVATDTDGYTIYWQNTTSGGTSTATAASTETISSPGTYYFNEYNGSCWGTQGGSVVEIEPVPAAPTPVTATPSSICSGSSSLLNATASGNKINWWTAATGGVKDTTVISGVNYSVSPAATTTYYAEASAVSLYDTVRITSSQSWTVPAGVTGATVYLWGGGGGAGGGTVSTTTNYWGEGGAGGGGACSVNSITLTPGQVWAATVGAGGIAGNGATSCTTCTYATAGGTSAFVNGGTTLSASGGGAGIGATGTVGGTFAGGPAGSTGTGTVYAGGAGSAGYNGNASNTGTSATGGGAGGSAGAGTAPAIGCGVTGTGGTGTFPGGNGGYNADCGTYTGLAGSPGSLPGGGGGGDNTYTSGRLYGGAGGQGEIIIVYPSPTGTTGCPSTTRTPVTVTVQPNASITLTSATGTTHQSICQSIPITNITYSVAGSGTGAGVTGLPPGVSGSYSGGVYTISGSATTGASGTYIYKVITTGTCTQATDSGTISIAAGPAVSIRDVIDGCNGGHTATVTVTGGTAPYSYTLTPAPGSATSYTNEPAVMEFSAMGATSYSISAISDSTGCAAAAISGSPVSYPARTLSGNTSGGMSQTCFMSPSMTKSFYDTSGNLMLTLTDFSTGLDSTVGVVDKLDATVQATGSSSPITYTQSYLQRHFHITPANNALANVCLYVLSAEASNLNTASAANDNQTYFPTFEANMENAAITKYDGGTAGATYETPANHASRSVIDSSSITITANPTIDGTTYNGVYELCFPTRGFSGFYIGANNPNGNPLPVTLIFLTATDENNKYIELQWATASETDNSGFEVQRSTDGATFADLGFVAGHLNSTTIQSYNYDDNTAQPGITYYYRLNQVDVDGHSTYTQIVAAALQGATGFAITDLAPNPANTQVALNILSNVNTTAKVVMTDMLGREVVSEEVSLSIGYNTTEIDLAAVAAGAYTVTLISGTINSSKRLIVAK
jgi:hypothetical protein